MVPVALLALSLAGAARAEAPLPAELVPETVAPDPALPTGLAARERRARRAMVTAVVGLMAIGSGTRLYREGERRAQDNNLDGGIPHAVSGSLLTAGGIGTAAVAATVLTVRTRRTAELLQDNGLPVHAAPGWLGLASIGAGVSLVGPPAGGGVDPRLPLYGGIGGGVLGGVVQYFLNRRAVIDHRLATARRSRASTSLAVVPTGQGLQLRGSF
jgi:hypothetical protein